MKALSSGNLLSFHPEHVTICPRLASASAAISSAAESRDTTRMLLTPEYRWLIELMSTL